jgi:hypothetical protein
MKNNVKIPCGLFLKTLELLDSLDDFVESGDYPPETIQLHGYVLYTFKQKKDAIARRNSDVNMFGASAYTHPLHPLTMEDDLPF